MQLCLMHQQHEVIVLQLQLLSTLYSCITPPSAEA
jgi:hypothetical protein